MQKIKALLTRDLSRKERGLIILAAVACSAIGLTGVVLTPAHPQGLTLFALLGFAGLLGALFHKACSLLATK